MEENGKGDIEKVKTLLEAIDRWLSIYEDIEERLTPHLLKTWIPYAERLKKIKTEIFKNDWTEFDVFIAGHDLKNSMEKARFVLYRRHAQSMFSNIENVDDLIGQAIRAIDDLLRDLHIVDTADEIEETLARRIVLPLEHGRAARMKTAAQLIVIRERLFLDGPPDYKKDNDERQIPAPTSLPLNVGASKPPIEQAAELSKPMPKSEMMKQLRIDSYDKFNRWAQAIGIVPVGKSRKLWQIRLDKLSPKDREKLEKA